MKSNADSPTLPDYYVGLSHLELPQPRVELGHGIYFARTYAHIFAPYMAAFIPAEAGKPHGAPWHAVSGGRSIDIWTQLVVPPSLTLGAMNSLDIAWWIIHLLRIRVSPAITAPVFSSHPFGVIAELQEKPTFWPMEMGMAPVTPRPHVTNEVSASDIEWLAKYWERGAISLAKSEDFRNAVEAASYCIWNVTPALGLITLWGAIERLVLQSQAELTFRVSATLSALLEPPGKTRQAMYQKVKQLYASRSQVAHGASREASDAFRDTHEMLTRLLMSWMEEGRVPSKSDMEAKVFGVEVGDGTAQVDADTGRSM